MIKINAIAQRVKKFIQTDIWNTDLSNTSMIKRLLHSTIKILLVVFKGIKDDKIELRASALTFFTLLSIVPVLAMAFGIGKGFGLEKELEKQLLENFSSHEEVLLQSLEFARSLLENTKGGMIAGIGLLFLFYAVMQLLNNIEASFNDIWYITKQRSFTRKLTDYVAIILISPILIIVADGLTIFMSNQIEDLTKTVSLLGLFKSVIFPLLRLAPFIAIWILFTLIYLIMPNTTVKFKSAFIAGILAGSTFQIMQWLLIRFQINVSEYNAIYGSFAAIPLFLGWLQISWLIVLYGSEISYAIQNVNSHESNMNAKNFSNAFKKKVALATSLLVVQNFKINEPSLELNAINLAIKVPKKLLVEVVNTLVQANILSEIRGNTTTYQPGIDTDLLTIQYILNKYDEVGKSIENDNEIISLFSDIMININQIIAKSTHNHLIKKMYGVSTFSSKSNDLVND